MLRNDRRRKELVFVLMLLSSTTDILKMSKFKNLHMAVFKYINPMDELYSKSLSRQAAIEEKAKVQRIANSLVPLNWATAPDEWKLWFALNATMRLVAAGWQPEKQELPLEFIQAMYNVAQNYNLANPPPQSWLNKVATLPEAVRKHGLFI